MLLRRFLPEEGVLEEVKLVIVVRETLERCCEESLSLVASEVYINDDDVFVKFYFNFFCVTLITLDRVFDGFGGLQVFT